MPKFHSLATSVELSVPKNYQSSDGYTSSPLSSQYRTHPSGCRRLEFPPRDRSKDYVLSEESLLGEAGMGFIGENQEMPFYLIRAGRNLFETTDETDGGSGGSSSREQTDGESGDWQTPASQEGSLERKISASFFPKSKTPRQQAATTAPGAPLPLTLTVTLSPPDQYVNPTRKVFPHDVKVDIFLNGEFTSSRIILARYRQAGWGHAEESFSGRRISTKKERVWVVVPPSHSADGPFRKTRRSRSRPHPAAERWEEIGQALLKESDCWGFDARGERSYVGRYLESLAKSVEMPKELEQIQKAGGQQFGVLDVVLSLGKVAERETDFLTSPQRCLDPKFPKFKEVPNQAEESSRNAPTNQATAARRAVVIDDVSTPRGSAVHRRNSHEPTSTPHPRRRRHRPDIALLKPKGLPRTPRTPRAHRSPRDPFPYRLSTPSAEQRRRLGDTTPTPVKRRPESIPVPIDISLLPPRFLAPATSDRHSFLISSSELTAIATVPTPMLILRQESRAVGQTRGSPSRVQDDGPAGEVTIVSKKRRHSNDDAQETPSKKRKPGNVPSTNLTDRIQDVDIGSPMSISQPSPGEGGITPTNSRHTSPNFSSSPLAQQTTPRVSRTSRTPRLNTTPTPVNTNDPFYIPPPELRSTSWKQGLLSQNAVLTYAGDKALGKITDHAVERVERGDAGHKGVIDGTRDTRVEKAAKFEVDSVLMAVRYILA